MLDHGTGVDVEVGAGLLGLTEALDQLGAPTLEERQASLGGEVAGEGEPEPEAAGVLAAPPPARSSPKSCRPASVIR